MSPSANTSGWPGSVRSGSTVTRPAGSRSAPVSSASRPARLEAVTPAAQTTVRVGIRSASTVTLSLSMPTTVRPASTVTPTRCSERAAFAESEGGNVVSTRSAASTSRMRAVRGSTLRKSRRSVSRASSAIWPAISTPVGPAPTTTNVSQASRRPRSGSASAASKALRRRVRTTSALSSDFTSAACSRQLVVPEVRVARAAGDDERVVGERRRSRDAADRAEAQLSPLQIEPGDLGDQHADVPVALEDRTQRIRDLAGGERAGRDLVGEWLEEVEVPPIDERHVDRGAPEPEGGLEPAETAADDDDAVPLYVHVPANAREHKACAFGQPGRTPLRSSRSRPSAGRRRRGAEGSSRRRRRASGFGRPEHDGAQGAPPGHSTLPVIGSAASAMAAQKTAAAAAPGST